MTFEEAERLHTSGRYAEVLRESLREQSAAQKEARLSDLVRWSLLIVQACTLIGRTAESLTQARRALEVATPLPDDPTALPRARFALAIAHRGAREYDEALRLNRVALEGLPPGACDPLRAAILLETADTSLEAGLRAEAEAALAKGSALVHWLRDPRLLAWSLYLRSHWEAASPADLQLSAAYEIARTVDCPELQWQILWRLSDRAAQQRRVQVQEDCLWNALRILAQMASSLEPGDATIFWRQGTRRTFMDAVQKKFGSGFFRKVMQDGAGENATHIIRDLGFDPASIPDFGRPEPPQR